jgi:hypothetical protein
MARGGLTRSVPQAARDNSFGRVDALATPNCVPEMRTSVNAAEVRLLYRHYIQDARGLAWVGIALGGILVFVGLFLGDWFTIVGAMLVTLGALRLWTIDRGPDHRKD